MSNEEMVDYLRDRYLEPPPDPEPVYYCDRCGCRIEEGERYWKILGDILCNECAELEFSDIAEDY